MIKLFRHLRKNQITENQTIRKNTNYFKYAVGEIGLVVIGILIAMQVNNWNENRKIRIWEDKFLNDLKRDLQSDKQQLDDVIEFQTKKGTALEEIMVLIKNDNEISKPKIDALFSFVQSSNKTFFPTVGVYETALASGKTESIQNDELKYDIMNLYAHYYKRLVYNGEIYDKRVDQVSWDTKQTYSAFTKQIISWKEAKSPEFYSQVEFLWTFNKIYILLAKANLVQVDLLINLINSGTKSIQ